MIEYIFSSVFVASVFRMTTPLLFAALAALVQRKANILCIGNESIMLFAAFGGVLISAWTNSLTLGFIAGLLAGELVAFIFALFVLRLRTDPMLIGLALNILGSGGTIYLMFLTTGDKGSTVGLNSKLFPFIDIPVIKDIPIVGTVLSGHNLMVYASVVVLFVVNWLVYKSKLGLRIRAVGENPDAAASVGINVYRTQFIAIMISGLIASLGGMYMSMGYLTCFSRDMVAGRSFIGIAAQNLGMGNPWITMAASVLFGAAQALANGAQALRLPSQLANMIPYVTTIAGLVIMGITEKRRENSKKKRRNVCEHSNIKVKDSLKTEK